ncbi:hypothetical protein HHK36_017418 [Tetracentron sinense]|uniref:DUF761 domain-containing protein n=1 Tax=Tetracentron sinense TaxID=13715 RepID=A0A834YZY4_TETSI|nr:hypothetical protein HHK36_017418 [Tetracentron sinense]
MVGKSHLKSLQPLHIFSWKTPYSGSNSMKTKTLIQSHFFRHVCRVFQALTKAKSVLLKLLKENQPNYYKDTTKKLKKKKKIFSSIRIRVHYNWCSSHMLPMPEPDGYATSHVYYDSTWNSIIPADECEDAVESQLSGYLHWLEEKEPANCSAEVEIDEIDRLADKFIANCHEKFRLEKQESYRRYQEMLARSM